MKKLFSYINENKDALKAAQDNLYNKKQRFIDMIRAGGVKYLYKNENLIAYQHEDKNKIIKEAEKHFYIEELNKIKKHNHIFADLHEYNEFLSYRKN